MTRPHVLLVDGSGESASQLAQYLAHFGFVVQLAADGAALHSHMAEHAVDMVVMDVMPGGSDGLALAQEVRRHSRVPIVMLSARICAHDRVLGLELGVDDYMDRPFEPRELVARINAILRRLPAGCTRAGSGPDGNTIRFDGWELRRDERRLIAPDGRVVPLSLAEYRLLTVFLGRPHMIFSRHQLMARARGRTMHAVERSIDLLVSRLRSKLGEDAHAPSMIRTVRGVGYIFEVKAMQPAGGLH